MGLRINTNIVTLRTAGQLADTNRQLMRSYARLASGKRIAVAADDPAGLGIAGRMKAELRSLSVAQRNLRDGISLVQVAEGSLAEFTDILHRTRELAVQSANGTLTDSDRTVLEGERAQLAEEAQRLLDTTEFNGQPLFQTGSDLLNGGVTLQIGPDETDTVDLTADDVARVAEAIGRLSFLTEADARGSLRILDLGIDAISEARGHLGGLQNRLESAGRSLQNRIETTSSAHSRIADVDIATETAELARLQILQQTGVSVLAQAGVSPAIALKLIQSAAAFPAVG